MQQELKIAVGSAGEELVECAECHTIIDAVKSKTTGYYIPRPHTILGHPDTDCPGPRREAHRIVRLVYQDEELIPRQIDSLNKSERYYANRWGPQTDEDRAEKEMVIYNGYVDPDTGEQVFTHRYTFKELKERYKVYGGQALQKVMDQMLDETERIARARIFARRLSQLPLYSDLWAAAKTFVDELLEDDNAYIWGEMHASLQGKGDELVETVKEGAPYRRFQRQE